METLKTALVVVLLLAVLYGVFVVLNKPDLGHPPEMAWLASEAAPPQVEFGDAIAGPSRLASEAAPPQVEFGDAIVAPSSTFPPMIRAHEREDSVAELAASPAPEAAGDLPMFDTRPAGATEEDLSPLVPRDAPSSVADVDDPNLGRRPSAYEQSFPYGRPKAGPADDLSDSTRLEDAWQMAMDQLNHERWADALRTLSVFYDRPEVVGRDRQRLLDVLDPLAGKVIYSTEHLLEPPYQVRPGETLLDVAQRYQVPVELLKNINGIADPQNLTPGSVLKVVRGPFRAEITLAKGELVLLLDDYYAGRFAVSIGNDPRPDPGEYVVLGKQEGREYFAPNGSRIPPLAPDNPYGRWWIDLGGDICIHASPVTTPTHGGLGCISLDSNDAADVFGILSIGSKVLIR